MSRISPKSRRSIAEMISPVCISAEGILHLFPSVNILLRLLFIEPVYRKPGMYHNVVPHLRLRMKSTRISRVMPRASPMAEFPCISTSFSGTAKHISFSPYFSSFAAAIISWPSESPSSFVETRLVPSAHGSPLFSSLPGRRDIIYIFWKLPPESATTSIPLGFPRGAALEHSHFNKRIHESGGHVSGADPRLYIGAYRTDRPAPVIAQRLPFKGKWVDFVPSAAAVRAGRPRPHSCTKRLYPKDRSDAVKQPSHA